MTREKNNEKEEVNELLKTPENHYNNVKPEQKRTLLFFSTILVGFVKIFVLFFVCFSNKERTSTKQKEKEKKTAKNEKQRE